MTFYNSEDYTGHSSKLSMSKLELVKTKIKLLLQGMKHEIFHQRIAYHLWYCQLLIIHISGKEQ